jgi:protein O-GlcNAc transferase
MPAPARPPAAHSHASRRQSSDALLGRAIALAQRGTDDEAELNFERAIAADPASPLALVHTADFYVKRKRPERAIPLFSRLTEMQPNNPECWRNLAVGYSSAGDHAHALEAFSRATAIEPNYSIAAEGMARSLIRLGRHRDAVEVLQQVLAREPGNQRVLFMLGSTLTEMGELDGAEIAFLQIIIAEPGMAEAHANIGRIHILRGPGHHEAALQSLQAALKLKPNLASALTNLGTTLLAMGRVDAAAQALRDALAAQPDDARAFSNLLFCLQNDHEISNEALYAEHRRFAFRFETPLKAHWPKHQNARVPDRKLRIGYVSADLRDHPVALFLEPLLIHRDRDSFELCFYSNHLQFDAVTERLKGYADEWTNCTHLTDDELATKIVADRIDILVDLSGHTAGHRLQMFARKPAPIQVTYMGYGGTTGLDSMDYRITDAWLDPVGVTDAFHSENLTRLPCGAAAFQGALDAPPIAPLPALKGEGITLACLNNPRKISPPAISLWARLLHARPDARLILGSTSDAGLRDALLTQFVATGIDASRIQFQPWMPMRDYLASHAQVDIALDPFPYNGGTTSYHSLWMGVPLVTLAGDRTMSRVGAGILGATGLDDWIAETPEQYIDTVLRKLEDLPALNTLRLSLRDRVGAADRNSPQNVTRALESAYRSMWRRWCASS